MSAVTCDWPGGCTREATTAREFGGPYCKGHAVLGDANADTHGFDPISGEEYRERIAAARRWFDENPQVAA